MVRATAIAPQPIASFRAVDVRGSKGRSAFERGSLAPPDPRAVSENGRGSAFRPLARPTPLLRAVVGFDSIEPRERFCRADDPMRWLLTVGVRGWVLIQPLKTRIR
jgi:hypothetical protein